MYVVREVFEPKYLTRRKARKVAKEMTRSHKGLSVLKRYVPRKAKRFGSWEVVLEERIS